MTIKQKAGLRGFRWSECRVTWGDLRLAISVFNRTHSICFPDGSDSKVSACNAEDPVQSLDREDPLEKEMATHSSILAWKIPRTEEPGRLQSMGLQRVRHD